MEITQSRSRSRQSRRNQSALRIGSIDPLTGLFFAAVFLFGGAGNDNQLANTLIVLLGVGVCCVRLPALDWHGLDKAGRNIAYLFIASMGLCALQVLPLPQGLWAQLPGHELASMIASALGGTGWTAWSLSPDRTLEAMAALVPPAAAFLIAVQASVEQRCQILRLILLVALLSAVIAIVQISAGPASAPVLFETRHRGFGVGLFVNRNHLALFLLIAMQIAALSGIPGPLGKAQGSNAAEWGMRAGSLLLLSLGVLATLSRTGAFLLPVALATSILINRRGRLKGRMVLGGAVVAALFAFVLRLAPPVQALFARYATAADDKRFEFWENTLVALRDAFPLGTGFGTFRLVYPTVEPLDQLAPDIVNHAHNDFLELILEGGLLGVALLLAWLAGIAFLASRGRKVAQGRRERLLPVVVLVVTGLALAASVVDYPLRMNTIAVSIALLLGMLVPITQRSQGLRFSRKCLLLLPVVALGLFTAATQAARQLFDAGGAVYAPWSGQLHSLAATRSQLASEFEQSAFAGHRALSVSPLDAAAVRAAGVAALSLGQAEKGAQLLSLGGSLGWRDQINQLWLIDRAIASGANAFAIERMDGMLRQQAFTEQLLPLMPGLLRTQDGSAALAVQLANQPGWRVAFFNAFARDKGATTAQLLELGGRLRQAKAPLTVEDTSLIRAELASQGRYPEVRQVWEASGQRALIGDGEFEARSGELALGAAPYEWMAGKLTGVRVETAKAQVMRKGQALAVTSQGLGQGAALAQTVVLTPGRYTLSFLALVENVAVARELDVNFGCRADTDHGLGDPIAVGLNWTAGRSGDWQRVAGSFVVPANCPAQTVMFAIPQTGGRPFSLWIDAVVMKADR